jgi:Domain of unknown function (DUF3883)
VARSDDDVKQRLVIARVGWCDEYNGTPGDEPRNGGAWNDENIGSEFYNFLPEDGKLYGFVRIKGRTFRLDRVSPDVGDDAELKDVCVAWIAYLKEYGNVLVGWYRHATMFGEVQERDGPDYTFVANPSNGVLIDPNNRNVDVPKAKGAMGQSNICYARDNDGNLLKAPFFSQVRHAILTHKNSQVKRPNDPVDAADAVIRGQGFQLDVRFRKVIEMHAMARVKRLLGKTYDIVDDHSANSSYDLLARKGRVRHKIEVKGTTTDGEVVLLSRKECELASNERVDLYIVRNIKMTGDDDSPKAGGGAINVIKDWGSKRLPSKALGFAITVKGR